MLDEMAGQRCHRQRHNQRLWKGQRWQKALELLRVEGPTVAESLGIAGRRARCPAAAQVVSYSATVSACKRASGGSRPLEVLDEMRGSMLQHNVVTYIATISA